MSTKIATDVDESLSKQQKALFLHQQLATINAELQRLEVGNSDLHGTGNTVEDEDELEALTCRVDTLPAGTEVHCVASTEACRLKRIPSQNAEHGVVRNYVRTSTFFSLYSRVLPDLRRRSLLPSARMAHCVTMGFPTCGFGSPHAV